MGVQAASSVRGSPSSEVGFSEGRGCLDPQHRVLIKTSQCVRWLPGALFRRLHIWVFNSWFWGWPEIVDFGCPGDPETLPTGGPLRGPPVERCFRAAGASGTNNNQRFPVGPNTKYSKPECMYHRGSFGLVRDLRSRAKPGHRHTLAPSGPLVCACAPVSH